MSQREVIHLTLGSISQHISTHFFNQQSSHFRFDDAGSASHKDDFLLDPNVDFQEGIASRSKEETFFPREVVVNFKSKLGRAWGAYSAVVNDDEDEDEDGSNLRSDTVVDEAFHAWSGAAEVLKTSADGRVGRFRHDYDEEEAELSESDADDRETSTALTSEQESATTDKQNEPKDIKIQPLHSIASRPPPSYAHNYSHPRGSCPLPRLFASGTLLSMNSTETSEGAMPFQSFELGMKLAEEMERNTSFSEESIRWFAENSDSLQCFNMTASISDGFSGFSHGVAQLLADDYSKTPVISWGVQTGSTSETSEGREGKLAKIRQMNNILSLWSLSNTSLYVPLQAPSIPSQSRDSAKYFSSKLHFSDDYQSAALYSAHIDTAMMRLRLRDVNQRSTASSLIDSLNWRKDTPIASLGGCMPIPLLAPLATKKAPLDPIEALLASRGYGSRNRGRDERNFETPEERAEKAAHQLSKHYISFSGDKRESSDQVKMFAQSVVARDSDKLARGPTMEAMEAWNKLQEPVGQSTFVPLSYNIQSASFPQIFRKLTSNGRPMPDDVKYRPRVQTLPMISSLITTPDTAHTIRHAYKYLVNNVIKGHEPLQSFGLGGGRGISAGQAASEESEGPLGGRDGLMEIRERLEELLGAYEGDDKVNDESDQEMGTDEEYEDEIDEWDMIE